MITVRDMAKNDEMWTPPEAILPLLPYVLNDHTFPPTTIWEMCPGGGVMAEFLREQGYMVFSKYRKDTLVWTLPIEDYDVIVTNPPWSKKHLFLERCMDLEKPFALLLPVRTLGVRRCQVLLNDVDVLFLARRVDFTGGGSPYEACAWFTRGLLPDRIVFEG